MNEPSGLLIFGILFVLILGILGLIALFGTLADRRHLRDQGMRAPEGRIRSAKLPPQSLREPRGQFRGSSRRSAKVPAGVLVENDAVRRSASFSAAQRAGTDVPLVPIGTVSVIEAALIGHRLGRGMAPSDVAKSLPGYSGKKYSEYVEKVRQVQSLLEQADKRAVSAQTTAPALETT